jgi:dTDP-4-dehydrorhamnose reductase
MPKTNTYRILITGSNGLLGQKLVKLLVRRGVPFLATSNGKNRNPDCPEINYMEMDITCPKTVRHVFEQFQPSHVVHTAALTNVDYCELHPEECKQVNVTGTAHLFEASQLMNAHFQLLSTDFVFNGKNGPYREDDEVGPLSEYARSKVRAEHKLFSSSYNNWSVVRTIIVYGTGHNLSRSNLILWAINALREGQELKIVDDQFRAPTWAEDLAWGCLEICRLGEKGIFHLAGPTTYSILEIVQRIAGYYGFSQDTITALSSRDLNQPAKRPPITGFDLSKAKRLLNYRPKALEDTLDLL